MPANAKIIFNNEFVIENNETTNAWVIDANDDAAGQNISLQFGNTLNESIEFDIADDVFAFSNNIDLGQNEIRNAIIENLATAPLSPMAGQFYHNTGDNNTYVYNGTGWEDIAAITSTSTKVVTVGTGLDYSSIDAASTYLNTLSGGMMLLSAETHIINTAVNLRNITLIGKDPSQTTIQISGAGQMDSYDTRFVYLTMDIDSITANMAIDVQSGSSSLQFEWVDFDIQDTGDSLIDSTAGTAPTTAITFMNCDETGGLGTLLKTQSTGNINSTSGIFVSGASGNNLLRVDDWDITIEGAGNVYTSGTITTIPDNTIFVYPGMNLQGALNSLPSGGIITLLPGTHNITEPLIISNDNIEVVGYGDTSIINASGFSPTGETIGAIQVGFADGSAPADGVSLKDFKVEVNSAIHGIRITGGADNHISNVTVQKMSGASGSGNSADLGIQVTDSSSAAAVRPVIEGCRVFGNGTGNYFTDGIHITSDGSLGGVWGNGYGIEGALVEGNSVDYIRESGYVFVGVTDSSLFNNRASRMGAGGGGAYGIYMGNIDNINMNANIFSGSLSTTAIAIGIDSFGGASNSTTNSIFNNNIIDGMSGTGAVGFRTGFQIGNASTQVHRNSFQSNTINGASNQTGTIAININGNADNNTFSNNNISGGTNAWDTGINLDDSTQDGNVISENRYTNVTLLLDNNGTATKIGVTHHRATTNPTTSDDRDDGYEIGTLWINTSTNDSFLLTDDTTGSANWEQINGGGSGGGGTLDDAYNSDTGERTIGVDNGDVSWDITSTYNYIVDLQGTGDLQIQDGGITFATFTDGGDLNLTNNFTVGSSTETIDNSAFLLNGNDAFIEGDLGVEGAIYTDHTETKHLWLDIAGGVRGSASLGSVNSGRSPVIRFDGENNSRVRYSFPTPDDWVSGTDIEVEVFWSPSDVSTGNVYFTCDYNAFAIGETITGNNALNSTESVSGTSLELDSFAFTLANSELATDDMINIRVNRIPGNAADTYSEDINIHMIRINYTGKKLL